MDPFGGIETLLVCCFMIHLNLHYESMSGSNMGTHCAPKCDCIDGHCKILRHRLLGDKLNSLHPFDCSRCISKGI